MKKFSYNILDCIVKFVKSITNPEDDWQPHPDYPWLEINENLSCRVNTKHPEWIKVFNATLEKLK